MNESIYHLCNKVCLLAPLTSASSPACIDLASSYDLKQKVHVLIYLLSKGIQIAKKRKLMSYYLLYNYELNIYL